MGKDGVIKILAIGNSFSQDALAHLSEVAGAGGVTIMERNLFIGGCVLQRHWENVLSDAHDYSLQKCGKEVRANTSIREGLELERWDYITLQQGSSQSCDFRFYNDEEHPYLTQLSEYVNKQVPGARQLIHETWAYANNRAAAVLGYTGEAPQARNRMFADVEACYLQAAKLLHTNVIPVGAAILAAQNRYGFSEDRMYLDGHHLSQPLGRVLASLVWYEAITGRDARENPYTHPQITPDDLITLKQIAHEVVLDPKYGWA